MVEKTVKRGTDFISDVPRGSHVCQFYRTKEDLTDILVPYFEAGLENNEFCVWITGELLDEKEIRETMRKNLPQFDHYIRIGQIEIIPYTEWYLIDGVFSQHNVLNAWTDKLNQSSANGYKGIRVTGDFAPLIKKDWVHLVDYETKLNGNIGKYLTTRLCTYPLEKCGSSEVVDVIRAHQFMLTKRADEWKCLEISITALDREGIQSPSNSKTIMVSGYGKSQTGIACQHSGCFCIELELDPCDFRVVDLTCRHILCIGEEILRDTLLGYKVEEGIKNAIKQVEKRWPCFLKDMVKGALEDANKWYKNI